MEMLKVNEWYRNNRSIFWHENGPFRGDYLEEIRKLIIIDNGMRIICRGENGEESKKEDGRKYCSREVME